jgi:hypothetical protein
MHLPLSVALARCDVGTGCPAASFPSHDPDQYPRRSPVMGEYEPNDSRKVTLEKSNVPGEPPRTGPREDEARRKAKHPKDKKGSGT